MDDETATVQKRAAPIRQKGPRRKPAGVIRAGESYHLDEFLNRVGWQRGALTEARKKGLRVVRAGGRCYVLGSDWIDYLGRIAAGNATDEAHDA